MAIPFLPRRHAAVLAVSFLAVAAWATDAARPPSSAPAQVVTRSIDVRMDDTMRFTPSALQARAGEPLRLVVRNAGRIDHELVLDTEPELREHARQMARGGAHHHHSGASVTVPPGQVRELVVTPAAAGTLQMACLVPGHYEAGMRGSLVVAPSATGSPRPPAPPQAHKH